MFPRWFFSFSPQSWNDVRRDDSAIFSINNSSITVKIYNNDYEAAAFSTFPRLIGLQILACNDELHLYNKWTGQRQEAQNSTFTKYNTQQWATAAKLCALFANCGYLSGLYVHEAALFHHYRHATSNSNHQISQFGFARHLHLTVWLQHNIHDCFQWLSAVLLIVRPSCDKIKSVCRPSFGWRRKSPWKLQRYFWPQCFQR